MKAQPAITVTGPQSVQETVISGGTIGTAYDPGTIQPIVATLAANDPDAGDTVTYSLVGAPAGLFTISGNEIRVAAGASFDYETTSSYTLTVRATDSAGNDFDQAVAINIADYEGAYTGTSGKIRQPALPKKTSYRVAGAMTLWMVAMAMTSSMEELEETRSLAVPASTRQTTQPRRPALPCHSRQLMETDRRPVCEPGCGRLSQEKPSVIPSPDLRLSTVRLLPTSLAAALPT